MQTIKSMSDTDYEFVVAVVLTTIAYSSYYFIAFSEKAFLLTCKKLSFQCNPLSKFCFEKFTGFIFLGLFPAILVFFFLGKSPINHGFGGGFNPATIYWAIGASLIIIPVNLLIAGKTENLKQYPQIKIKLWNKSTILIDAVGWFIYLLAYEYLLRGLLFFGTYTTLGIVNAIALNTAIYALVHIHKGAKETFGSIPVGILVCFITFATGNIWASFLIHLVMALSNEFVALYRHPAMFYQKNAKITLE